MKQTYSLSSDSVDSLLGLANSRSFGSDRSLNDDGTAVRRRRGRDVLNEGCGRNLLLLSVRRGSRSRSFFDIG